MSGNGDYPITPLPPWTILPGDPEPLKAWLRAKAAAAEPFPDEEDPR